ncbi:pyridoxal phosphate-dependent aminotransferase [Ornithinimicrobium pratense]|uniref:Aminotransferase n=1 Tax=Ornithinimicrobium pratense TaxID=2593973 RepID=A0A5J6V9F2_9MICO|nr:pyridoxal phosphate-dependent aminotransferase [Ornithinimicrobium pratense]QFG69791.1 pyridoxal phosphate-dependent aminotransferase [Ornithinimicrobium pratense]
MSPASRVTGQRLSPIRRMAVGAPPGTINLALGEPGWPLPDVARQALADVGQGDGPLPYGPNTSRPDLVEAIADYHSRTSQTVHPVHRTLTAQNTPQGSTGHATVSVDQIMVTSGSQAALFALFQAHVEPGSTVLVPDPGFVSYPSLARLCDAEPVGYPLAPGGHLDAEALVETLLAHPRASMVVLCHPANPTGGMASAADLTAVAETCAARGVLLVSDEVYRELWVDEPPPSLHDVAAIDTGVVLGSMSKAFGAPGLRLGWAVGGAQTLAPARIVHNAMTTAPAQPSQAAALALLKAADEVLADSRGHVRRRWGIAEQVAPALTTRARSAPSSARAGIYLWVPVPRGARDAAGTDGDDPTLAFALRLRDEGGVTTVPGSAFGPRGAGHLRVSLGGPLDDLEEGLRRLAPWWTT